MPKINEATDTDLKVIEDLTAIGWKRGDTLLYQQEYQLTPQQQSVFEKCKSIKPDISLSDWNGNVIAVIENKFVDEKKALTKLRSLYAPVLKPRFLYACSPERILFYDTNWKGLDAGEFRQVDTFLTLEEMLLKIEQAKQADIKREIVIDKSIAGGFNPSCNKEMYFQSECISALLDKYRNGKQKMLVHMATGLGKTRTMVAFVKALLEYNLAKRVLFVVDRIMLAEQALNDGFALISKEYTAVRITSSNYRTFKNSQIHIIVVDTLENIFSDIPCSYYDLIIVDECHRSININRKLIFDHFICPRIGLTATPRKAIAAQGSQIAEDDISILDTYRLFGCETGEPDYQFDLKRGIDEQFLAPYKVLAIETELTKLARENGVEFNHVLDPDERTRIELDKAKKLKLEQLEKKYIAEDRCLRIAEEIKASTEYGEKVILFGASQAHCLVLVKALNKVFATPEDEASPRYAEAVISENNDLNATFKKWFKDKNHKPFITVSVDIMSTGVDIPCVRYIAFAALTKSVGKYIQMLGRGTRLDPKSGKFSFKVLDFTGLCAIMKDNGQGTLKRNEKIIKKITKPTGGGNGGETGGGGGETGGEGGKRGNWFIIDNPDPAHLIQRVWLHGDKIQVVDNIPIEKAQEIFEQEVEKTPSPVVSQIRDKARSNPTYEPTQKEIESLDKWARGPDVYLDNGQLQKIYDYKQGTIWDFFLQALKIRPIPKPRERIEKGFDIWLKTYNYSDDQIHILRGVKDIFVANVEENKKLNPHEVFDNPVYNRLLGGDFQEINRKFNHRLSDIIGEMQSSFKI